MSAPSEEKRQAGEEHTVTLTNNSTGKSVTVPIHHGTIRAPDLLKIGLRSYDPGFKNTAFATSRITMVDGDAGKLAYRGYPIEELAERSNFLEVAFLLLNGELPTKAQNKVWVDQVMSHTCLHTNVSTLMQSFRYDAHPMGMVLSTIAALGTFYPEANPALAGNDVFDSVQMRNKQILRIIGKLPTIAACAYRHRIGRPYNMPAHNLSYTENFLYMMDRLDESDYRPHPGLARALDQLFILHADHELNCSTAAMRHISSAGTDPYTSVAGAMAALYGPLHGGANEAVLRMLEGIGSVEKVPEFIEKVKARKVKLMGWGHRLYKNYDPRARIIRKIAYEVFDIVGDDPLIAVAVELERLALHDPYFTSRKLYPNVDFFSGLIYKAIGLPTDMFPVLFAIPRAVGWLAHWIEHMDDPETKIARPRQIYAGAPLREFKPMSRRTDASASTRDQSIYTSRSNVRRNISSRL